MAIGPLVCRHWNGYFQNPQCEVGWELQAWIESHIESDPCINNLSSLRCPMADYSDSVDEVACPLVAPAETRESQKSLFP